jgi:hypothetical protein
LLLWVITLRNTAAFDKDCSIPILLFFPSSYDWRHCMFIWVSISLRTYLITRWVLRWRVYSLWGGGWSKGMKFLSPSLQIGGINFHTTFNDTLKIPVQKIKSHFFLSLHSSLNGLYSFGSKFAQSRNLSNKNAKTGHKHSYIEENFFLFWGDLNEHFRLNLHEWLNSNNVYLKLNSAFLKTTVIFLMDLNIPFIFTNLHPSTQIMKLNSFV